MTDKPETPTGPGGMSLRDWFAGQALQGTLAHPASAGEPEEFAAAAYEVADAMMKAREPKNA